MQAQDAGLVRILCVAREGAYETLHEPPTADPHGGWCGGWELEAPGYPISQHWRSFAGACVLKPLDLPSLNCATDFLGGEVAVTAPSSVKTKQWKRVAFTKLQVAKKRPRSTSMSSRTQQIDPLGSGNGNQEQ